MKKMIMLFSLLLAFSCEDIDDAEGTNSLVGNWEMSNLGEYANADCSGTIDYSGWAMASAFGMKVTMEFTSDGTGTYSVSALGETEDVPLTWDESKSQICLMGVECHTYKVNDNKFTIDTLDEALCVDDNDEETSHTDQSSCEAAGNNWEEAVCTQMEFTKE
jgi:hypothetical protein|tara:strand:- start:58 stop:543 length:486 start_codon:yes stop_codon:yes gene_type:complete